MVARSYYALLVITVVSLSSLTNWLVTGARSDAGGQQTLIAPTAEPPPLAAPRTSEPQAVRTGDASAGQRDDNVRLVSHSAATSVGALAAGAVSSNSLTVTRIEDSNYRWPVTSRDEEVYLITNKVVLHFNAALEQDVKLRVGSDTVEVDAGESTSDISSNLPRSGKVDVRLQLNDDVPRHLITLFVPNPDLPRPRISAVSTNPYIEPGSFTGTVSLFGDRPLVRLSGRNFRSNAVYRFFQTKKVRDQEQQTVETEILPRPTVSQIPGISSGWKSDLTLRTPVTDYDEEGGKLLLLSIEGDEHTYLEEPLGFTVTDVATDAGEWTLIPLKPGTENPSERKRERIGDAYRSNETRGTFLLSRDSNGELPRESVAVVRSSRRSEPVAVVPLTAGQGSELVIQVSDLPTGRQDITAEIWQGNLQAKSDTEGTDAASPAVQFDVKTRGPRVERVEPQNFGTTPGVRSFKIHFTPGNRLELTRGQQGDQVKQHIELLPSDAAGGFDYSKKVESEHYDVDFDPRANVVTVRFTGAVEAALYQLTLRSEHFQDVYGNPLEGVEGEADSDYVTVLGQQIALAGLETTEPSVRPGITGSTGEYVRFPEFTQPREVPRGFNPHDKVETRVARLYYYRDAHRVAQIINRRVKSHNRAGVDMERQLADKARTLADQTTAARQQAERKAIARAEETRKAERRLSAAQRALDQTISELTTARRPDEPAETVEALDRAARSFTRQIETLQTEVERAREQEIAAAEEAEQLESDERLAREEQFRREVAAAHADPDTYAPGRPRSPDPVEQVSVSVIGEGLIHLRGPIKGINTIRTMIDQIDSPLGQTRISVHTVQINGEDESRMEDVANVVQMYIDQSRFLTLQSSEMLRRAVVQVAARKAEEARALYPGDSQDDRDRRYLEAFFGWDFIDELITMDSEFLRTGNKLLSLHSMDTTSLASALNLLALAKNSVREEIFAEFEMMIENELPAAEARYLEAGITAGKNRKFDFRHPPEFYPLAHRAKFESLRAFFNSQIGHDDTMTPLQREFIRLAQIFKSRLITEIEYKQRVMERAVIEDRFINYQEDLKDAQKLEDAARDELSEARTKLADHRAKVNFALSEVEGTVESGLIALQRVGPETIKALQELQNLHGEERHRKLDQIQTDIDNLWDDHLEKYKYTGQGIPAMRNIRRLAGARRRVRANGHVDKTKLQKELHRMESEGEFSRLKDSLIILTERIGAEVKMLRNEVRELEIALGETDHDIRAVFARWSSLQNKIEDRLWMDPRDEESIEGLKYERDLLKSVDESFQSLLQQQLEVEVAQQKVEEARRPLDHKKFLDMLIDQLEEKYIELLEGTRAHTANVDNYLKRLTTALDDDFNTQFYLPTFRYVRETSTYWDVQFGQTETTSILTNNREFAKVSPSATMEFDLPKRDLLINEALNGALANVQDFGALLNDPTFLAAAQMQGPQSAATPEAGSTAGFGVVRDVLPGLDSSTAEQILAKNADTRPRFGANLENLIPDPAIYKFETGTGYEIRPVIQPDGQAVVFDFNYMYTTNVREPVRPDEKHLGRVKRHYVDTDVQLSNFELREVSRYTVALKAARTSRGVPLLEDLPLVGALWRPLPSQESSLQQNVILAQATIFPTLFDLMGLRWAPAVADLDPLRLSNEEFTARGRNRALQNRVYDHSSAKVDEFLRIPEPGRRPDLYRTQESIPRMHPNGYQGPGLDLQDSQLQEGYQPERAYPEQNFIPSESKEGAPFLPGRRRGHAPETYIDDYPLEVVAPGEPDPGPVVERLDAGAPAN